VRADSNIENALDLIDREILQDEMGISQAVCARCRSIWKKLKARRLGRSDALRPILSEQASGPIQMMLLEKTPAYIVETEGHVVLVATVTAAYRKWIAQRRLFACSISEVKGQMRMGIDRICIRVKGHDSLLCPVAGTTVISGRDLAQMKCPKKMSPAKGCKLFALGGGEA